MTDLGAAAVTTPATAPADLDCSPWDATYCASCRTRCKCRGRLGSNTRCALHGPRAHHGMRPLWAAPVP